MSGSGFIISRIFFMNTLTFADLFAWSVIWKFRLNPKCYNLLQCLHTLLQFGRKRVTIWINVVLETDLPKVSIMFFLVRPFFLFLSIATVLHNCIVLYYEEINSKLLWLVRLRVRYMQRNCLHV